MPIWRLCVGIMPQVGEVGKRILQDMPPSYEVDDLPPPVNADYSFASYHSKSEVSGNTLKYTRTFEVKELSVPLNKVEELKKLYRVIAGDERNTAVLKPVAH